MGVRFTGHCVASRWSASASSDLANRRPVSPIRQRPTPERELNKAVGHTRHDALSSLLTCHLTKNHQYGLSPKPVDNPVSPN